MTRRRAEVERTLTKIPPPPEKLLLSVPEAAFVLGLSERTVWYLLERQRLASVRVGRAVRISRQQLDQFIADETREGA